MDTDTFLLRRQEAQERLFMHRRVWEAQGVKLFSPMRLILRLVKPSLSKGLLTAAGGWALSALSSRMKNFFQPKSYLGRIFKS
jgi:hypothetical protein